MEPDSDRTNAFIEAAAELLDIPVEPEWLVAIRANLDVTMAHARDVQAFPLPDEAEPASIFEV